MNKDKIIAHCNTCHDTTPFTLHEDNYLCDECQIEERNNDD